MVIFLEPHDEFHDLYQKRWIQTQCVSRGAYVLNLRVGYCMMVDGITIKINKSLSCFSLFLVAFLAPLFSLSQHASANDIFRDDFESYAVNSQWKVADTTVIKNCGLGDDNNKCLRVKYVPKSNGSARLVRHFKLPKHDHYVLTYDIFFEPGFDFVRGGKLPGLGSAYPTTGCDQVISDAWSVRGMWLGSGTLRNYIYGQDKIESCGDGEISNGTIFNVGQWHRVEVNVKLNSSETTFDGHVIMKVDNKIVADDRGIRLRKLVDDNSSIQNFVFSTFFGGNDQSWAPPTTVYARFDNFKVEAAGSLGEELLSILGPKTFNRLRPLPPKLSFSLVQAPVIPLASFDFNSQPVGELAARRWKEIMPLTDWATGHEEGRVAIDNTIAKKGRSLKIMFPGNIISRDDSGVRWQFGTPQSYNELALSYWLYLEDDFDFANGGKLPGIGHKGDDRDKNWRALLSWKSSGRLALDLSLSNDYRQQPLFHEGQQPTLKRGEWQFVQFFTKLNSSGQEDGSVEVWLNDTQVGYINRIDFAPDSDAPGQINKVYFNTYVEQNSNNSIIISQDQHAWFDDVVVSQRPL